MSQSSRLAQDIEALTDQCEELGTSIDTLEAKQISGEKSIAELTATAALEADLQKEIEQVNDNHDELTEVVTRLIQSVERLTDRLDHLEQREEARQAAGGSGTAFPAPPQTKKRRYGC